MENSVIKQRWSLCILASFFGFLFLISYLDQGRNLVTIVASLGSSGSSNYNFSITNIGAQSTELRVFSIVLPPKNSSSSLSEFSLDPVVVQEKDLSPRRSAGKAPELSNRKLSPQLNTTTSEIVIQQTKTQLSLKSNSTVSTKLKEPTEDKCDIFDGVWVYDSKNYPLYQVHHCSFLSEQVSCQKNGRPDSSYEHWRWKPRGCEIPRFNGTYMLERLRGKRVAIIGDSLNRNQWESLSCLLYSSIHPLRAIIKLDDSYKTFRALDYDFSLEFFWSPFLVKLDKMKNGSKVLKLNQLAETSRWQGADVMVFNTGHWWTHRGRDRAWDYYEHHGELVEDMEGYAAFETALSTWASWIDQTVNATKANVFFRSISPEHKQWNLHWCYNQIHPITNETYRQSFPETMISIVEKTIKKMKTQVQYLNITRLSEYRRDAHTSLYTTRQGKLLTEDQQKQPELYADCSHWCLPGLPDTWNVLLYAYIVGTPSINLV